MKRVQQTGWLDNLWTMSSYESLSYRDILSSNKSLQCLTKCQWLLFLRFITVLVSTKRKMKHLQMLLNEWIKYCVKYSYESVCDCGSEKLTILKVQLLLELLRGAAPLPVTYFYLGISGQLWQAYETWRELIFAPLLMITSEGGRVGQVHRADLRALRRNAYNNAAGLAASVTHIARGSGIAQTK